MSRAGFAVRSRWRREFDEGRKDASAVAPGEARPVAERKRRFSDVLSVNAERRDMICAAVSFKSGFLKEDIPHQESVHSMDSGSSLAFQGRSCISEVCEDRPFAEEQTALTNASAMDTSPATSILFSLRFNTFNVRFLFRTCEMYVMPPYFL